MLDAVLGAGPSEDVSDEAALGSLVVLDELNAVIRQHRVDLVGNSSRQRLEETRRHELRCCFGPIGSSSTVWRSRHFLTVFSLIPKRRANSAAEACDRCRSIRTACVVVALP